MKRMLVNATQREELRVAVVDGQRLYDLDIEVPSKAQRKSNIYKGRITRIEPSLEAAFINYGAERHGFLPLKEISPEYYISQPEDGGRVQIKDVLKEGQEIVVQVEKEERGNKGAALTTYMSLAGRFLVLMPNNPRAGGVSRRILGDDRDIVRQSLDELKPPEEMGCIVRTAGVGRSTEELQWDLDYLLNVWEAIKSVVVTRPAPFLIYQEGNAIVRALRDNFSNDIGEILIDDPEVHKDAHEFMERVLPHNLHKLKFYEDESVPLFTRYQIESQIESAFSRAVTLPSGGSIVVDHTEALTAIDINSARATKGDDIEQTALNTNLESADEIARQLRLRDLGGLVVIDFIDMTPQRNQRDVENRLREAVRFDRARIQIGKISRFGLLELSRQRLRPSLEESTQAVCPRCNGNGVVRSVESLALAVLRLVSEEARKDRTSKVIARLPVEVSNFILNEKREWVGAIQNHDGASIVVVGDPGIETPNYEIRRVRDDELENPENSSASYALVEPKQDLSETSPSAKPPPVVDVPAVSGLLPSSPAPTPAPQQAPLAPQLSLFKRISIWLFGAEQVEPPQRSDSSRRNQGGRRPANRDRQSNRNERRNNERPSNRKPAGRGNEQQQGQQQGQQRTKRPSASNNDSGDGQPSTGTSSSQRGRRTRRRSRGGGNNASAETNNNPESTAQNAGMQGNSEPTSARRQDQPPREESSRPAGDQNSRPSPTQPSTSQLEMPRPAETQQPAQAPRQVETSAPQPSQRPAAPPPAQVSQPRQVETSAPQASQPRPAAPPAPQAQPRQVETSAPQASQPRPAAPPAPQAQPRQVETSAPQASQPRPAAPPAPQAQPRQVETSAPQVSPPRPAAPPAPQAQPRQVETSAPQASQPRPAAPPAPRPEPPRQGDARQNSEVAPNTAPKTPTTE
jgi:ribonuclease E